MSDCRALGCTDKAGREGWPFCHEHWRRVPMSLRWKIGHAISLAFPAAEREACEADAIVAVAEATPWIDPRVVEHWRMKARRLREDTRGEGEG